MTTGLSTGAGRSMTAVACMVVLGLLSTRIASTQGTSGTEQQLSALRQQVSALDRRVKELEKMAISVPGDTPDATTFEGRIAQLESKVRSLQSREASGAGNGGLQATKVVAPFIVVDHAGREIARITEGGEAGSNGLPMSRGLYVVNGRGQIASHLGATDDGSGRIYVRKDDQPIVVMGAKKDGGGQIQVGAPGKVVVQITTTPAGGALNVFNLKGEAVSWLETTDGGNARFVIGRAGAIFVEAGVLENGRGMVVAGPQVGGAPAGLVTPNMLIGRKQ
jgi:hypothetical protein